MKNCLSLTWMIFCCCLVCKAQLAGDAKDSSLGREEVTESARGVVFLSFSGIVKEVNKVLLQWDVDSADDGDYFIVERGSDGVHYETIGAVRKTGSMNHYELFDSGPPNGSNYYRIKSAGQQGGVRYSKAVQLSVSGDVDFKFYPNPVDKLLIIRTQHAVDIQVIDASGGVRISRRLQPGIQVVNASSLEHGIYVLQVADKESNRVISNQLVKN